MGKKTDPMGGPIFNFCIAFYTRWNDIWVTQLTPWGVRYWTFVLLLHALERHIGNKTDPMGGSIFNMSHCVLLFTCIEPHMGNKTDPMGGSIFNISIVFLHPLERHRVNTTDPMGEPIFNICIVFYTHWNDIWVTKLTPFEGRYSTSVLFFTCIGTTYR